MGDEMNACEYFWSHELAMRRLLNFLRNGQTYCTDGECIDLPAAPNTSAMGSENNLFMLFVVFIMAVLLYVMRPRTNRANTMEPEKTSRNDQGGPDDSIPPAID